MGRNIGDWASDHFFAEMEFRVDQGIQVAMEVEAFGGKLLGSYENNTTPLAQINVGYNNKFYGKAYSFDNPKYGYNGINEPLRNGWSGGLIVGASSTYSSRRGLFRFGNLQSETSNLFGLNISKTYRSNGSVAGQYYYWNFGFDFAAIYGLSYNFRFGYKRLNE